MNELFKRVINDIYIVLKLKTKSYLILKKYLDFGLDIVTLTIKLYFATNSIISNFREINLKKKNYGLFRGTTESEKEIRTYVLLQNLLC